MQMHYLIVALCLFGFNFLCSAKYIGGIPVPGRSVPSIRIFELYAKSCALNDQNSALIAQLSNLLKRADTNEIASDLYSSLYLAVGEIDVTKLMGRWFTVVDSPSVHHGQCPVFYFSLLDKTPYTATFSVRQYSRNRDKIEILEGYGKKIGPDPAEILINIGHPFDPCPYSIVRNGQLNVNQLYDYVILTQPFKYPTIVLARDPIEFNIKHKQEVKEFLENQHFWDPSSPLKNALQFINTTECFRMNQYNMGF